MLIQRLRVHLLPCFLGCMVATAEIHAQTLQEAVDLTVRTNPEILSQANRRLAADEGVPLAESGYYPKVDFSAGIGWEKTKKPSFAETEDMRRREAGLTLRQMLFDGYATKTQVDTAESQVAAAANRVASDSERLGLSAATVYLDVLRQAELLSLAQQSLEAHQKTFDKIKSRSDQGFGSTVDFEQVSGRLALAQSNVTAAEGNLQDAQSAFLRVVGVPADALQLTADSCCDALIPATVFAAIELACSKHPELLAAIADLETRLSQAQGGGALYSPEIRLDLGANRNDNIDGLRGRDENDYAMIRGDYNFYRGGADKAKNRELDHLSEAAKDSVRFIKRKLDEAVRLTWNARQQAIKSLPYLEQRAIAAEKTRDAYRDQFDVGQRTLLDLLDSENELLEARATFTEGRINKTLADYRLMAALGLLLQALDVAPREEAQLAMP